VRRSNFVGCLIGVFCVFRCYLCEVVIALRCPKAVLMVLIRFADFPLFVLLLRAVNDSRWFGGCILLCVVRF